jgi:AraC-like DNA-binding protein
MAPGGEKNLTGASQTLAGFSHLGGQEQPDSDNFREMAVVLENIRFAPGECLRLLCWHGHSEKLELLQAGGRRLPAVGVGGRWHSHAEMEFTIFTRGVGTRYVGDHVGAFGEMDCVLLGSHLPHCWVEEGRTDGYVLQFHLAADHPLRRIGGARELHRLTEASARGVQYRPAIAQAALALVERMASGSALARAGLLLELLALLHEAPPRRTSALSRSGTLAAAGSSARPRLEAVVQWVLEEFTHPLTLEEAVKRSAMSRATFCRQFLKHTGKTFVNFVTDARLAYAHHLLTQTERSVTDIAFASGFGSLTRFNATFRSCFKRAPREARRGMDP